MSEQACANRPDDTIELNGHRYVSEAALASWCVIEIMVRNPSVSEAVSDLEARLEKARKVIERNGDYVCANCLTIKAGLSAVNDRGAAYCSHGCFSEAERARAWMEQNAALKDKS